MKTLTCCLALLFAPLIARGDSASDAAAALALAQAQSKPKAPVKEDAHEVLADLEAAKLIAKRDRLPLLVRYGDFPCVTICSEERGTCVVVHLPKDAEGERLRMLVYYPARGKEPAGWYYHDWKSVPTREEVRRKAEDLLKLSGAVPRETKAAPIDWTI